MTERYENDKVYRALVNALWYNVGLECLDVLYNNIKEHDKDSFSFSDIDDAWYDDSALNQYWTMFVEMFGDCGTSPRSGWIYKTEESLAFFKGLRDDIEEIGD